MMDLHLAGSEMSSTFTGFIIALTNGSGVFPTSPSRLMSTLWTVSDVAILGLGSNYQEAQRELFDLSLSHATAHSSQSWP